MRIFYDDKADLLYLRFDEQTQEIINHRITDDIVVEITDDKLVGIEILDASQHINLAALLPVQYQLKQAA